MAKVVMTNQYVNTKAKRRDCIVKDVITSSAVEGVSLSKNQLRSVRTDSRSSGTARSKK